jgi:hypothetical protein
MATTKKQTASNLLLTARPIKRKMATTSNRLAQGRAESRPLSSLLVKAGIRRKTK